jgi:hypothetical protein
MQTARLLVPDSRMSATASFPWRGLERLLDRAVDPVAIRSHRLQTVAAPRWRATGREVPADFEQLERIAVGSQLAAPAVLEQVRELVEGPILLHKGPQAAHAYPDAAMRGFDDLDLLVRDPVAVQRALVAAGFVEVGDPARYVDLHHLRPLKPPGLALRIEIHGRPKWPDRLRAPSFDEFVESSVPAAVDVEGIDAPSPTHHALVLAAHSWAHVPLRRVRDLLDLAAVTAQIDAAAAAAVADAWSLARVWRTSLRAADCIFGDGPRPAPLRTWARHLVETRERTVFEAHLQLLLSHFWELPPSAAWRAVGSRLADEVSPAANEDWDEKLLRTKIALRNARRSRSDHDRALGPRAQRSARRGARIREEEDE